MSLSKSVDLLASAMDARARAQEVHANNLANITTDGFLRQRVAFAQELATQQDKLTVRSQLDRTVGPAMPTGRLADVAMLDDSYLVVATQEGERYVRGCSLTLNAAGEVATRRGEAVVGDGGRITPGTADFQVAANGEVVANGAMVGRLRVVQFPVNAGLSLVGGGLIASDMPPVDVENPVVVPGHRQSSNVDLVGEMVTMVESNRLYEVSARALRAYDDVLSRLMGTTQKAVG